MKIKMGVAIALLSLVVGSAFWTGCGSSACNEAADHVNSCFTTSNANPNANPEEDCSGSVQCNADCENAADCKTIIAALMGDQAGGKSLLDCLEKCSNAAQ